MAPGVAPILACRAASMGSRGARPAGVPLPPAEVLEAMTGAGVAPQTTGRLPSFPWPARPLAGASSGGSLGHRDGCP